jgi:ribosomal protein S18 acetylase RimI-like enzyme
MMQFREAQHSDVAAIARLHANSWQQTYRGMMPDAFLDGDVVANRLQLWNDRLANDRPDQFVCLAEDGANLVGFICAIGNEDPVWGSFIENMHVAQAYKRQGIGTELMQAAAVWLKVRHADLGVYLWAIEANDGARRFYERLGGENVGTLDRLDPAGGSAPNCRYVWANPEALIGAG